MKPGDRQHFITSHNKLMCGAKWIIAKTVAMDNINNCDYILPEVCGCYVYPIEPQVLLQHVSLYFSPVHFRDSDHLILTHTAMNLQVIPKCSKFSLNGPHATCSER